MAIKVSFNLNRKLNLFSFVFVKLEVIIWFSIYKDFLFKSIKFNENWNKNKDSI